MSDNGRNDELRVRTDEALSNPRLELTPPTRGAKATLVLLLAAVACAGGRGGAHSNGALDHGDGLRGFVIAVQGSRVRISCGSRDGVREGDIFVVERIMTGYVGRIRIKSVERNYAVGAFLYRATSAHAPQPGDTATRDDAG